MKKYFVLIILLFIILLISGCVTDMTETDAQPRDEVTQSAPVHEYVPSPAVTLTLTPEAALTPEPKQTNESKQKQVHGAFTIQGTVIYKESGDSRAAIYDAAEHFPEDWDCWLGLLVVEPDALYITEGGMPADSDEYLEVKNAIIHLNRDGRERWILHTGSINGYEQLLSYGNRLFFIEEGFDSVSIGWAYTDGSEAGWLDFSDYATRYGVETYYLGADLFIEGRILYADISFFVDADPEIEQHIVRIGSGLFIQHVETKER